MSYQNTCQTSFLEPVTQDSCFVSEMDARELESWQTKTYLHFDFLNMPEDLESEDFDFRCIDIRRSISRADGTALLWEAQEELSTMDINSEFFFTDLDLVFIRMAEDCEVSV